MIGELEVNAIAKAGQDKLRGNIETFLRKLGLEKLAEEEWVAILRVYPKRYWGFMGELMSDAREEFPDTEVEPQGTLCGNLRDDIDSLLKALSLSPLTDKEWCDVLLDYSLCKWKFIGDLIGDVRGEQHFLDVEAAIERERVREEKLSVLVWSIDWKYVEQFCDDSDDAPLSDEEMEELFDILDDQFDRYEIIDEAMDHLRKGTRRNWRSEPTSTAETQCV
jgi:hypothetical protein